MVMALSDYVYNYLISNFKPNEPILLSEINIPGLSDVSIRQQVKKLTEKGQLKHFDTAVYYIPTTSIFQSGSCISLDDVIRKKYLIENNECCGYVGEMLFANKLGITTQVPSVYEVYTNKATTAYRETYLNNIRVIIRKPCCKIDQSNAYILQFLDLLKEVTEIAEVEGLELTNILIRYMESRGITFEKLKPYLKYYPNVIYRNMYEVGLLQGTKENPPA